MYPVLIHAPIGGPCSGSIYDLRIKHLDMQFLTFVSLMTTIEWIEVEDFAHQSGVRQSHNNWE
jgi:hypothetical protein